MICPLFAAVSEIELKLADPDPFAETPVTGSWATLFTSYDTVDVVLGNKPSELIVAAEPPQIVAACEAPVNLGNGFTETVIVNGDPTQEPVVEVGVTTYSSVPAVRLEEFTSV